MLAVAVCLWLTGSAPDPPLLCCALCCPPPERARRVLLCAGPGGQLFMVSAAVWFASSGVGERVVVLRLLIPCASRAVVVDLPSWLCPASRGQTTHKWVDMATHPLSFCRVARGGRVSLFTLGSRVCAGMCVPPVCTRSVQSRTSFLGSRHGPATGRALC